MERLTVLVPDEKVELVRAILKEIGCVIESDLFALSKKLNMIPPGEIPAMEEIVEEVRAVRAGRS